MEKSNNNNNIRKRQPNTNHHIHSNDHHHSFLHRDHDPPCNWHILAFLVIFRVANALFIATSWVPDEYWQSLEIAHLLVFKYGTITWEWLPSVGIRGFAHPLFFAAGYWSLDKLGLDHTHLFVYLPLIQQGILAALCDYYTWRLAMRVLPGNEAAKWALVASCFSWYHAFSLTRTLANSMETTIFVSALYYWYTRPAQYTLSIFLLGGCIWLRPTSGLLFASHVIVSASWSTWLKLAPRLFSIGLLSLAASVVIDYWGYSLLDNAFTVAQPSGNVSNWNKIPIVALNFFILNVTHGISTFYGTHPWHWYFTSGWATLLGPYILIVVPALIMNWKWAKCQWWITLPVLTTVSYSFIPHKEFRFLACVLPLAHLGVGMIVANLMMSQNSSVNAPKLVLSKHQSWYRFNARIVLYIIAIISVALSYYFCRIHQAGAIPSMNLVRQLATKSNIKSIYQLMPCHSTPMYSHLHIPIRLGWITCEPPLDIANAHEYQDETTLFFKNTTNALLSWNWPDRWGMTNTRVAGMFNLNNTDPADLVMAFDSLWQQHSSVGFLNDYIECGRTFNSHWIDDSKRAGDMVLLCRKGITTPIIKN